MDLLFSNKVVRRFCILLCCAPLAILAWGPPWALKAYVLCSPLLFLGFGLLLVDIHLASHQRAVEAIKEHRRCLAEGDV